MRKTPRRRNGDGRKPGYRSMSRISLAGMDVVLVGYFSAKDKQYEAHMDALTAVVERHGARVVGRFTQRRGVSDGGVRRMTWPYSSRTLISSGKVREIATARQQSGADAVVFLNTLTDHQRRALAEIFECPVLDGSDLSGGL